MSFKPITKEDLDDVMNVVRIIRNSKELNKASTLINKVTKQTGIKKERVTDIVKYIGKN